ncbi:MAG: alanine--tRNA ligase [Gemmatimonadales bacterium]
MRSAEIRQQFLDYFKARGHRQVASAALVPADDPTLLFTNAGMVQFKRVFQGLERRDYSRAVTCQMCVRAGGKHNDLEQVGHTARHHTFFEMLGNFSFGDYFKKEAIEYAWEWETGRDWLGIAPGRLYITVHHGDDEARKLWRQVAGVPDKRIYGLGDADNFWQMGETGPCGPCSEILVDMRERGAGSGTLSLQDFVRLSEAGQLLEIWNLVFMQYDLQKDGSRLPLPAPSVDTGAGLERIAAVMQGVPSNFDTDLFRPIIDRAVEVVGKKYDRGDSGASYRVLADHARAVAFLLADGVYPSNEGRGYVLRRILRRAVRHAWLLGRREPTLVQLAHVVTELMGDVYPDLVKKRTHIESVTRAEEERFFETIEGGLRRLDELKGAKAISGEEAFKLYDTFGFPIDLTQLIAAERGQTVDLVGFERALAAQRERSRVAGKGLGMMGDWVTGPAVQVKRSGEWRTVKPKGKQKWVGYETTRAETDVLRFRQSGDHVEVVLEENPFYAESGGQVSDTGRVRGEGWELEVADVEKVDGNSAVVGRLDVEFEPTTVLAQVDEPRRTNIERNHTATHLVHAALRVMLGPHVRQQGSVVAPDRLRFDFAHHGPVEDATLARIEEEVNRHIWENLPVVTREMTYKEAIAAGAMAFFTEKYGDVVRVVDVPGVSLELCGGTHVPMTGQIALFRFTHETGAAAGVRRIEAVTGPGAYHLVRRLEEQLAQAAGVLKAQPEHLARRIERLLEENRKLEKRIEELLKQGAGSGERGAVEKIGDVELYIDESTLDDRTQIGALMDAFRANHKRAISVLFTNGDRPGIHVAVTDDLVAQGIKAGEIAGAIAAVSGGKGGGRPHFASAGAGDPGKLAQARAETPAIVRRLLAR